jgi:hypothetical protein
MSALNEFRLALVAAIDADSTFAKTQVVGVPPGENEALKETVWVKRGTSDFEFRSLGANLAPTVETLTVSLVVRAYAEGPDALTAGETAVSRAEAMTSAIGDLIVADPSVDSTVTFARMSRRTLDPVAVQSGWTASCDVTVEAKNYP